MKTVENLAFKGGGVLGSAYVGAYKALQEVRLLGSDKTKSPPTVYGNVKRVAGTSAGAIFATLVALGLTYEETEKVLNGVNFQNFVDFDPDFAADGGFLLGEKFLNWMTGVVREYLPGPAAILENPTFGDLADAMKNHPPLLYKDLHVFSRQVWPGRTVEFCAQSTPDVPIAEAVRASMSIPFIFKPWTFPKPLADRYPGLFFDGGTAFNYPVSAFDSGEADKKTLGFYLADQTSYQQSLFPELLVHMAMQTLNLGAVEASVVEAIMEWFMLAYQRGYVGPIQPADFLKGPLADAAGAESDLVSAKNVLAAVSEAQQKMQTTGKRADAAVVFKNRNLITQEQFDFFTAIDNWYGALCAVQNTPTNMVFDRDASRTIFIDTLGYIYFDFYLPDWDKQNLIDSGYACTRSYLSFIMYS
jgi:predicted acylesterase/phospholipase RssA